MSGNTCFNLDVMDLSSPRSSPTPGGIPNQELPIDTGLLTELMSHVIYFSYAVVVESNFYVSGCVLHYCWMLQQLIRL